MTATKSKYWGVTKHGEPMMTGTFAEAWAWLTKKYRNHTMQQIDLMGVKISRIK